MNDATNGIKSADEVESKYVQKISAMRQQRAEALCADWGWLTLAGLYWLHEGDNSFGRDPSNDIVLPNPDAPLFAGTFVLSAGQVHLRVADGIAMTANGKPVTSLTLRPDTSDTPDYVTLGDMTMVYIPRGARHGIRLYDISHPVRRNFQGLHWYPIQESYCIAARYTPYEPPKPITIMNVLGDAQESYSPGYVEFELDGETHRLDAEDRNTALFFNFGDQTNRQTTYGAGRFLSTDLPDQGLLEPGNLVIDFNRATNPYCAYTPYATCPLPPPDNHLTAAIEAGEMRFAQT